MEAKNKIDCRWITSSSEPVVNQVEITYTDSFPVEERRPFPFIKELIDEKDLFRLYVIERDYQYAGFITLWFFDDFVYVEHFAIDPAARNGGIGAKTIELIRDIAAKPVVLEVELPVDEFSQRRIGFYERCDFVLDSHVYFQPPYHMGDKELEMRLMSTQGYVTDENFEAVKRLIYKYVYRVEI